MAMLSDEWQQALEEEFRKPYYKTLFEFVKEEYSKTAVYPPAEDIFNAMHFTPLDKVKVLLLGQDPYHNVDQAHGLSFSVLPSQTKIPPSLQNIYKELQSDLGIAPVNHGYLKKWAKQGVLLLNSVLTVRDGQAFSHRGQGWEALTDLAIQELSKRPMPVVFILWGKAAQNKLALIDQSKNVVIMSPHPSPLSASRGFFGSKPFSKTNAALEAMGETPIDWQLPQTVNVSQKGGF